MGSPLETLPVRQPQGDDDRFGPLADGTPYDLSFVFEDIGYNFEPSEIGAAYGSCSSTSSPSSTSAGSTTSPASTR